MCIRDRLNSEGGVLDKQVVVETQDDQGNADQVATIVTRFITSRNVDAVLGEVASSLSLRAAPICQENGVPLISPASTNPKVTEQGEYVFRVCFTDPFQAAAQAKFARENLKAETAAILRDVANAYSVGLADYFRQSFQEQGGRIVADKSYQAGDDNFRAQLTDIAAEKPDVLLVPGYYNDVSLIAKQARAAGIQAPLLGGDGWDSPNLVKNAGTALEGSYFTNHFSVEDGAPEVKAFVDAYTEEYGDPPNALAALGYDAMRIYADAVVRAGSADKQKVRDALAATKDFRGVTGVITIDENRNASKPIVVLQVQGDKFAVVDRIRP